MANPLNVAVAWFRAEDYEHIRSISADRLPPTFAEWEAKMTQILARSGAAGIIGERVIMCPDELLAFARRFHLRKIDNQVRSRLATLKLLQERPSHHGARLSSDGLNRIVTDGPSVAVARSNRMALEHLARAVELDGGEGEMSPHTLLGDDGGSDMDRD